MTVEYFIAAGTLDSCISQLLEQKIKLITAIEIDEVPEDAALAVMGNHEFNAIAYFTPDGNGSHLRPRNNKNTH